ncbi:MAG: sulfatase [Planctomycetota bacterium]
MTISCGLLAFGGGALSARAAEQPNLVLIFIDDLGWKDVGCYGNSFVETPRIDRLAAEGLRFTDFYAAGAVCSPTRCALQTGQNQARIGVTAHIPGHWRPFERVITPFTTMALPLDAVTIADALQNSGYATGYVGKWHLGGGAEFQPDRQGYEFCVVVNGPHLPGKYRVQGEPGVRPRSDQYRTDFEADLCVEFITRHRDGPFLLMVSPFAVHIPLAAMSDKVEKYRAKAEQTQHDLPHPIYAAMIEHCDHMVGRIVDALVAENVDDDTLVAFTSDNGGLYRRYDYRAAADDEVSSQAPLRGEKGTLYEGGVRVPLIVKYPPLISPGGVCREPTISYDFFPTFVELAGGKLPANQTIDGLSLKPLFQRPAAQLAREALHWHYPHYHHDRPASSIRNRRWKLIDYLDGTGDVELYDLTTDLSETNNLVREQPRRTNQLQSELSSWRNRVLARMPIPNPAYDPQRADQWWNRRTGKPVRSDQRQRFPPTEESL